MTLKLDMGDHDYDSDTFDLKIGYLGIHSGSPTVAMY